MLSFDGWAECDDLSKVSIVLSKHVKFVYNLDILKLLSSLARLKYCLFSNLALLLSSLFCYF